MGETTSDMGASETVRMERFERRSVTLGFASGQEKTIEYDTKQSSEVAGEQFRQFIGVEHSQTFPDTELESVARKRNVFTVTDNDNIVYRQLNGTETMHLVSWDGGKSVRVVDGAETELILDVAAAHSE